MRKLAVFSGICLLVLAFSVSVYADVYSTANEDFTTKFWKEKYFGGDDGSPGNVLMAVGEGFVFQNAVLESVVVGMVPIPGQVGMQPGWVTTYTGGRLTLNPSGPWDDKIILRDVTATNMSSRDGNGYLFFTLSFSGTDPKSGATVDVTATFYANDDNYEKKETKKGKPVFQRGYDFDAEIEITY
jgi:hypothetical protein